MRIALILPFLNEEALLEGSACDLLDRVEKLDPSRRIQLVLSDSGSRDASLRIARELATFNPRVRVIEKSFSGPPSIGKTVRQALKGVAADLALVCPVDVRLSDSALRSLLELPRPRCGGFEKSYDEASVLAKCYQWSLNRIRARTLHNLVWTNCFFFPKDQFRSVPAHGFLEDVIFSDQLKQRGDWVLLPGPVHVSFRRYHKDGTLKRILVNFAVLALFRLGIKNFKYLRALYQNGLALNQSLSKGGDHDTNDDHKTVDLDGSLSPHSRNRMDPSRRLGTH